MVSESLLYLLSFLFKFLHLLPQLYILPKDLVNVSDILIIIMVPAQSLRSFFMLAVDILQCEQVVVQARNKLFWGIMGS